MSRINARSNILFIQGQQIHIATRIKVRLLYEFFSTNDHSGMFSSTLYSFMPPTGELQMK
jgi:hypothetical protein